MDPLSTGGPTLHHRFPRPRGDGPRSDSIPTTGATVSPPTRGWTQTTVQAAVLRVGFPAHAGMDPGTTSRQALPGRFPRPRGDGPSSECTGSGRSAVSPPTRGWTLHDIHRPRLDAGFPAHAGMDPPRLVLLAAVGGFPRPRGDGPCSPISSGFVRRVSPPTRGWTPVQCADGATRRGFPAHAGMDPRYLVRGTARSGFPRPRGDGPPIVARIMSVATVSPPTRGWTLPAGWEWRSRWGFPAHAGMDPATAR